MRKKEIEKIMIGDHENVYREKFKKTKIRESFGNIEPCTTNTGTKLLKIAKIENNLNEKMDTILKFDKIFYLLYLDSEFAVPDLSWDLYIKNMKLIEHDNLVAQRINVDEIIFNVFKNRLNFLFLHKIFIKENQYYVYADKKVHKIGQIDKKEWYWAIGYLFSFVKKSFKRNGGLHFFPRISRNLGDELLFTIETNTIIQEEKLNEKINEHTFIFNNCYLCKNNELIFNKNYQKNDFSNLLKISQSVLYKMKQDFGKQSYDRYKLVTKNIEKILIHLLDRKEVDDFVTQKTIDGKTINVYHEDVEKVSYFINKIKFILEVICGNDEFSFNITKDYPKEKFDLSKVLKNNQNFLLLNRIFTKEEQANDSEISFIKTFSKNNFMNIRVKRSNPQLVELSQTLIIPSTKRLIEINEEFDSISHNMLFLKISDEDIEFLKNIIDSKKHAQLLIHHILTLIVKKGNGRLRYAKNDK